MQLTAEDIERVGKMPMNFIVGKERSGTTLLQVLLNSHPNICAPPETRFIILLYSKYGTVTKWTEKEIKGFCNYLFQEELFSEHWKMNKQQLSSALIAVKEHLTYPLVCKCIYYLFAPEGKDVKALFDKNPIYYYFLPELENIFPEAKFIHLVRDYRDNIASHQKVFRIKQAAALAYRWVQVNKMIEARKKKISNRYFTVKYEALVTNAAAELKKVCAFLHLPYNDDMSKDHTANIYQSFKENKAQRFSQIHGSLLQPISDKYIGDWKKNLTNEEIKVIEDIAGNYGKKLYGYEPGSAVKKLNTLEAFRIKVQFILIKKLFKFVLQRPWLYFPIKKQRKKGS